MTRKSCRFVDAFAAVSRSIDARENEADERLRERLHVEELAVGDRIRDLVGSAFTDQVGDARVHDHHLDGRHAPPVDARQQPLADDAAQHAGEDRADHFLLLGREELDDASARLGRVDGVERRENQVARLGGLQSDLRRLGVAELADEDHVGVLAQRAPQRLAERRGVEPDLALADDAALLLVDDLDRILDRQDVVAPRAVDVVDHRGERCRLARAGRARDEHETARLVREALDARRQAELVERRDDRRDDAEGEADLSRWRNAFTRKRGSPATWYATSRSPVAWKASTWSGRETS